MGQQEEVAAVLKPLPSTTAVVFSWEPVAVTLTTKPKPAAAESRRDDKPPPGSPTTKAAAAPPARRLSVPPPPGRAAAVRSLSSRAVRPEDDPFLAAYLACTKSGSRGVGSGRDRDGAGGTTPGEAKANKQARRGRGRFTWARSLGLSCKSSAGVVERSLVKVAKRPELDPRDA